MLRRLTLLSAVLLLLAALVACAGGASPAPAALKEPYKIGVLVSTTGPAAIFGQGIWQGAQFAAEAITATGGVDGHPVEVVLYNDEGKGETAVTGYTKLAKGDNVVGVAGPILSTLGVAMEPQLMTATPPSLSFSTSLFPKASSYLFSINHPTEAAFETMVLYLTKLGVKKVGLMADTTNTGEVGVKAMESLAARYKFELVTQRFEPKAIDVTPQLARLRDQKIQALAVSSTGSPAALVARNVEQMGLSDIPLVLSEGNGSEAFMASVKDVNLPKFYVLATRGFAFADLPQGDPLKGPGTWISAALEKKYGKRLDPNYAHYGADAVAIIAEAIKVKKSTDPTAIKEFLEGLREKPLVGSVAVLEYEPGSHITRAVPYGSVLLHLQGGTYKLVPESVVSMPKGISLLQTYKQMMKY